eukprot:361443-Chlamydomonas_euryale.AAC.1
MGFNGQGLWVSTGRAMGFDRQGYGFRQAGAMGFDRQGLWAGAMGFDGQGLWVSTGRAMGFDRQGLRVSTGRGYGFRRAGAMGARVHTLPPLSRSVSTSSLGSGGADKPRPRLPSSADTTPPPPPPPPPPSACPLVDALAELCVRSLSPAASPPLVLGQAANPPPGGVSVGGVLTAAMRRAVLLRACFPRAGAPPGGTISASSKRGRSWGCSQHPVRTHAPTSSASWSSHSMLRETPELSICDRHGGVGCVDVCAWADG